MILYHNDRKEVIKGDNHQLKAFTGHKINITVIANNETQTIPNEQAIKWEHSRDIESVLLFHTNSKQEAIAKHLVTKGIYFLLAKLVPTKEASKFKKLYNIEIKITKEQINQDDKLEINIEKSLNDKYDENKLKEYDKVTIKKELTVDIKDETPTFVTKSTKTPTSQKQNVTLTNESQRFQNQQVLIC